MTKTRDEAIDLMVSTVQESAKRPYYSYRDIVAAAYDTLIAAGVIPQIDPDMKGYIMRCRYCREFHARLSCPTPPQNIGDE